MTNSNPLAVLIEQDLQAAQNLLALLQEEREALEARDRERLQTALEAKLGPMQILEHNAQQRANLLTGNGYSNNNPGWEKFLTDRKMEDLLPRWSEVKDIVQQAKAANDANGKLIARNRQTLEKLRNLIRGQTGVPTLYTNAGKTTGQANSHTLIKA